MTARRIPGLVQALKADGYAHCFAGSADARGVLVGMLSPKGPPTVEASLRAIPANGDTEDATFTHSSWERIHAEIDAHYPGRQIVGWYGTHPGHGLSLFENDRFLHRNFFHHPGQIAVIVDPLAAQEVVYRWNGDDLVEHLRLDCDYDAWEAPSSPTEDVRSLDLAPGHDERAQRPRRPVARLPPLKPESYVYLAAIVVSLGVIIWELLLR